MILSWSFNVCLFLIAIITGLVSGAEKEKKLNKVPSFVKKRESRKTLDLVNVEKGPPPAIKSANEKKPSPKQRTRAQATSSEPSFESKSKGISVPFLEKKRKSDESPRRQAAANAMAEKATTAEASKPKPKAAFQKSSTMANPSGSEKSAGPAEASKSKAKMAFQKASTMLNASSVEKKTVNPEPVVSQSQVVPVKPQVIPIICSSDGKPKEVVVPSTQMLQRKPSIGFNRVYKSAMQRRNVNLRKDLDTPSRKSVGMSRKLATWFRIYDSVMSVSDETLGYHFKPGSITVTLRYGKATISINIAEILIIKDLKDDDIVISKKLGLLLPAGEQLNVIVSYTSAGPKNPDILKNLEAIHTSPDMHYYRLRDLLKNLIHSPSYTYESLRTKLLTSEDWRILPSYYILDLAEDLSKEIEKFVEGPIANVDDSKFVLLLKWDVYRILKGYSVAIKPGMFIKSQFDLQDIFDEVLSLKSVDQLEELLSDPHIWQLHINLEITKRMVRHLHRCKYLRSFKILSLALERFENAFVKANLKSDILYFMERARSSDHISFKVIRSMLTLLNIRWPPEIDQIWVSNYLEIASRFPIEVGEVGDWAGSREFTMFIAMFWSTMPQYFVCDGRSNLFKLSQRRTPRINPQDIFLEFAPMLKCLDVGRAKGNELVNNLTWFQAAATKFIRNLNAGNIDSGFDAFCYAIDFYMHVSGFVDYLIKVEFEEKITGVGSTDKLRYYNVATEVIRQLLLLHSRYASTMRKGGDIPTLQRFLGNRQLRRLIFLLNWTANPRIIHNVGSLTLIAKENLLSFIYLVLGQGWPYSEMKMLAGMLMKSFEDAKIGGGQALLEVIARIGEPVSPFTASPKTTPKPSRVPRTPEALSISQCSQELAASKSSSSSMALPPPPTSPPVLIWDAPRSLWDLEDPDHSIPVLRTFLALKFGINFTATKSDVCEMLQDRWAPFEFEAYVNFFLERYCRIHGKEPAFVVRIQGDLFRWLKDHPEEDPVQLGV